MLSKLLDVSEDSLDKTGRCCRILDCDVVCDCVEVSKRGLGPDYLSHRDIRDLALVCETIRPAATAISPWLCLEHTHSLLQNLIALDINQEGARHAVLSDEDRLFVPLELGEDLRCPAFKCCNELSSH